MSTNVIEGTWEEVKRHEAKLVGRQVRLTVRSDASSTRKVSIKTVAKRLAALNAWFALPRPTVTHIIDDTREGICGYAEDRG